MSEIFKNWEIKFMKKSKFKRDIIWCIKSMFLVSIMLTSVLTFSLIPMYAEETDTGNADRKEYGNHIYQKYELPLDWYEAKAFCESIGRHLATIASEEEQAVVDCLLRNGSKNSYWIGGNKDSKGH